MFEFEPSRSYVFGKRKATCSNPSNVEYSTSPQHFVYTGQRLADEFEVFNFDDYLRKNPNGYNAKDKITCSELDAEGYRQWLAEGQPYSRKAVAEEEKALGLSDQNAYGVVSRANNEANRVYRDQLRVEQQKVFNLEERVAKFQDENLEAVRKNLRLDAENKSLLKEKEILQRELDDLKTKLGAYLEKFDKGEGLADGVTAALSNPAVQGILGMGANLLGALAQKWLNPGAFQQQLQQANQQQTQQQPAQQQPNNQFSVNPEDTFNG